MLDASGASPLPGESSVKFDTAGTYTYYCLIHPFMAGFRHRPVRPPEGTAGPRGGRLWPPRRRPQAATREYWVAAVPVTLNIAPNGRDAIHGTALTPAETVFGTVVYRRYTKGWKRPIENVTAPGSGNTDLIPGPLIRARVGDKIRVHFKNLDTAFNRPHSMHFHGVEYKPDSDGSYLPGFSGPDADVKPGKTWTYKLTAGRDSVGAWPYHDHGPEMGPSLEGGMFGMLSILGKRERGAGPRVRGDLLADGQVPGRQRPRVRRQHAGVQVARG